MGENNGRVTLPSRKGATGALPCPEVHRGALAPALAEHPHPPPPISVAANTPPPHSYRKSFLPTQRLNAQCAPQWQAHVVMGRYKGIGMPKAKKKKVMQAPALETNIMITLATQEAAGSSSKQVGPVASARVPLSPEKGLRDAPKAKAANAGECAVRAVNRVAEAQRAFLMAVRLYSRRVDAIERAETSTPPKPAWKVIQMCDKADGDVLAAQQKVDSLTHVMQEALLRVSEAENRVAYWEKRKLERRIRL